MDEPAWAPRVRIACCAGSIALGLVVLAGWALHDHALTSVSSSWPAVKPLAGVGLVLAGLGAALDRPRAWRGVRALALILLTVGATAALLKSLLGVSTGPPVSPKTAIVALLFTMTQLTIDLPAGRGRLLHRLLLISLAFTACATALGYLYGSASLTSARSSDGVSVLAAAAMVMLLASTLLQRPERAPARWLWSPGPAGTLVRRLAPCVVLGAPALGFLALLSPRAGTYDPRFGLALLVGSLMLVLLSMLLVTALRVERGDQERDQVAAFHAGALETSLMAHVAIDESGAITAWNHEAERIFGHSASDALGRQMSALIMPERRRAAHARGVERYLRTGQSRLLGRTLELSAIRADGSEFPIEISVSATEQDCHRMFHAFIADISARRAADAERRLLATVVESTMDAVITVDCSGLITSWNDGAKRLYGYRAEAMIGRFLSKPGTPMAEQARDLLPKLFSGEHVTERGLGWKRRDGSTVYVDLSGAPLLDDEGRLVGAAVIARDVTERVHRDQEARRLATVVEQSDDAIIVQSVDGVIREWNKGAERLFGHSALEAIGRPASIIIPPDRRDQEDELLRRAALGRSTRLDTVRVHSSGARVDVSLTLTPIVDASGSVVAVSMIAHDVTERKRAERRVLGAEKRFRQLLDSAPDAIVIANERGDIELVNAHAEERFGYARDELIGEPIELLIPHAGGGSRPGGILRTARLRPIRAGLELAARRRDGSEFPAELSLAPLPTDEGVLISVAIRDISSRRLIERERERALIELEEAQRLAGVGSWWWDPAAGIGAWSAQMYRILDRDLLDGPAIGEEFLLHVHPDDRERVLGEYRKMLGRGEAIEFDCRVVISSGETRVLHALAREDSDEPGRFTGTVQDVTALRAAERSVREAEERFRRAFDEAPIGMALISLQGVVERANTALGVISERSRSELEGVLVRDLIHPPDREHGDEVMRALRAGDEEQLAVSIRLVRSSGAPVEADVHVLLLRDANGSPTQVLCQVQDVTDRNRFEAQLRFMADHDPLTGLLNRRRFEEEIERHLAHVKRYRSDGAVIVLDIDHFKSVNDMLGHASGDELIVSIAGLLRRRLRESDVLARLGGDEFAILLAQCGVPEAANVAESIVAAVRSHSVILGGTRKSVTTSAGVAMFDRSDPEDLSAETILIEADLAMYDAKEAGRGRYAFFETSPHLASRTKARLTWAGRIEHALEHDRLTLMAQPIVDLRTGQIHGHELLIRMLDERDEIIPPVTFLGVAERYGLIARIDEWVSRQAVDLIDQRPSARLSVNISGLSLGDERLLGAIADRLQSSQIDPGRLTFEVTETGAVTNLAQAQEFAHRLRDLGCRFALDDFGAGFGSFYYLKHLPFDYVKIDGEFVQNAVSGRIDQLVIEAVVGIAQGLGEETIAEFVTDEKTKRTVRRLGVDYAQGRYIGDPRPVAEVFELAARAS